MNPIVEALLKQFVQSQELDSADTSSAFEQLVAYCALSAERLDQGDFRDALTDSGEEGLDAVAIGATGPNQLKAYRRTGMGPCQGRLCGLTVTELMAQARGKTAQEIGYYRLREPVKPITLAELAAGPKTEADIQAVVRG